MTRKGWLVALCLVIVANVLVLAAAAMNRRGAPEATIRLTERELPLDYRTEEDTGIYLRLRANRDEAEPWLDKEKLETLGFDCSPPITAETAEFHYDRQLPREAFVVLEYEGKAWAAWLERQQKELDRWAERVRQGKMTAEQLETERARHDEHRRGVSRLFPVDAGPDAAGLRSEYPDRSDFLIVPAVFTIEAEPNYDDEGKTREAGRLRGRVSEILVNTIHVGGKYRTPLLSITPRRSRVPEDQGEPRYAVTLTFGKRYEPWVTGVEELAGSGQPGI